MKFEFDTTRLKSQIEENPLLAAGVGAGLLTGAAKLLNSVATMRNSKTYKKEVNRRIKNSK